MASILVVDDEPGILQFIGAALEFEGHDVTLAWDGQQAVEVAAAHPPEMVILDMSLPRLTGHGVADAIRQRHGDVPILLITADGSAQQKAQRVGAFNYLSKPFDVDRLLELVQARLAP